MKAALCIFAPVAAMCAGTGDVSPPFVFDARNSPAAASPDAAVAAIGVSAPFALKLSFSPAGDFPSATGEFVSPVFVLDTGGIKIDTDGDGIPDWWAKRHSGSKTGLDAASDADADGMTALQEFAAGTNPNDPDSKFVLSFKAEPEFNSRGDTTCFSLTFDTAIGRTYKILGVDSLSEGWDGEPLETIVGTGGPVSAVLRSGSTARFYRVVIDIDE